MDGFIFDAVWATEYPKLVQYLDALVASGQGHGVLHRFLNGFATLTRIQQQLPVPRFDEHNRLLSYWTTQQLIAGRIDFHMECVRVLQAEELNPCVTRETDGAITECERVTIPHDLRGMPLHFAAPGEVHQHFGRMAIAGRATFYDECCNQ